MQKVLRVTLASMAEAVLQGRRTGHPCICSSSFSYFPLSPYCYKLLALVNKIIMIIMIMIIMIMIIMIMIIIMTATTTTTTTTTNNNNNNNNK
jgi:uncharacterized membrane protein